MSSINKLRGGNGVFFQEGAGEQGYYRSRDGDFFFNSLLIVKKKDFFSAAKKFRRL